MLSKFEKYLLEEENLILEFSNIGPRDHNFGVDVKLHLMQPADKQLQHAARIKIFKKGIEGSFSIALTKKLQVIGNYKNFVTTKELKILLEKIEKYKDAFLSFWYDPNMSIDELKDLFDQIDKGFSVEIVRQRAYYNVGNEDLK